MRELLNAILLQIAVASLSDLEFNSIPSSLNAGYNAQTYNALLGVLNSRNLVSNDTMRLKAWFESKGVEISEAPKQGKSNIFIGGVL